MISNTGTFTNMAFKGYTAEGKAVFSDENEALYAFTAPAEVLNPSDRYSARPNFKLTVGTAYMGELARDAAGNISLAVIHEDTVSSPQELADLFRSMA